MMAYFRQGGEEEEEDGGRRRRRRESLRAFSLFLRFVFFIFFLESVNPLANSDETATPWEC